jgi:hypothetical protein
VGLAQEFAEIAQGPVIGVDAEIVGDIVTVVPQGRRVKGEDPDGRDSQVFQVGEFFEQAPEIADAIPAAVVEALDVDLVDDRVPVPRVGF